MITLFREARTDADARAVAVDALLQAGYPVDRIRRAFRPYFPIAVRVAAEDVRYNLERRLAVTNGRNHKRLIGVDDAIAAVREALGDRGFGWRNGGVELRLLVEHRGARRRERVTPRAPVDSRARRSLLRALGRVGVEWQQRPRDARRHRCADPPRGGSHVARGFRRRVFGRRRALPSRRPRVRESVATLDGRAFANDSARVRSTRIRNTTRCERRFTFRDRDLKPDNMISAASALARRVLMKGNMTTKQKMRIEAESFARYLAANWPAFLGGQIAIAAKLRVVHDRGGHWIYTPIARAS